MNRRCISLLISVIVATPAIPRASFASPASVMVAAIPTMSLLVPRAPSLTLAERVTQSGAAVLARRVGVDRQTVKSPGHATFRIERVLRDKSEESLKIGDIITTRFDPATSAGDLFLVTGSTRRQLRWFTPHAASEAVFDYLANAPSPKLPTTERLQYYMTFLEHPDPIIARDVWLEFLGASYEDLKPLADRLPLDQLRRWVTSPEIPPKRLSLYGRLIGMCGSGSDAKLIEARILGRPNDSRIGMDGLMTAYLMLRGPAGLDVIDEHTLRNHEVHFVQVYSAMQGIRFIWKHLPDRIDRDRLRQSMRIPLDRPDVADLVIADLARWQDWSVQDRLMELYDSEQHRIPGIRRAIVRYMLISAHDVPEQADNADPSSLPEHVRKGRRYLEILTEKDPQTVKSARRFFVPARSKRRLLMP